jgi:hypothetical protein
MEPQNNERINLQKAINAHEEALHALADVVDHTPDPVYEEMMQAVQRNLEGLRGRAAQAEP